MRLSSAPLATWASLPSTKSRIPTWLALAPPPIQKWMKERSMVKGGLEILPTTASREPTSVPGEPECVLATRGPSPPRSPW
jgi:hypothetical protein